MINLSSFIAIIFLFLVGCVQTSTDKDVSLARPLTEIQFVGDVNDPTKGNIMLYAVLSDGNKTTSLEYIWIPFYTVKLCKMYFDNERDLVLSSLQSIASESFKDYSIQFVGCKPKTINRKKTYQIQEGVLL